MKLPIYNIICNTWEIIGRQIVLLSQILYYRNKAPHINGKYFSCISETRVVYFVFFITFVNIYSCKSNTVFCQRMEVQIKSYSFHDSFAIVHSSESDSVVWHLCISTLTLTVLYYKAQIALEYKTVCYTLLRQVNDILTVPPRCISVRYSHRYI